MVGSRAVSKSWPSGRPRRIQGDWRGGDIGRGTPVIRMPDLQVTFFNGGPG